MRISLPNPMVLLYPLKSNFGPKNGIFFATIIAVYANHDICILRFRGLYKPWHMFVCHGFCEPWREFTENLTRGYKKRSEGEKKKGSYSMHIFNISAIHRQFFFLQMLHRHFFFFCGRDCIETRMWFKLHPLPFFSVVEITSGNLCGYNYSDSCINT